MLLYAGLTTIEQFVAQRFFIKVICWTLFCTNPHLCVAIDSGRLVSCIRLLHFRDGMETYVRVKNGASENVMIYSVFMLRHKEETYIFNYCKNAH